MTGITTLDPATLVITRPIREQAEDALERASDREIDHFVLSAGDVKVEIGADLAALLARVISCAAHDGSLRITTMPEEVTTTVAAREIGVSRPTLMKLVAAGELPARKVRSHTRIRSADVTAYLQSRREARAKAFEELRQLERELGED